MRDHKQQGQQRDAARGDAGEVKPQGDPRQQQALQLARAARRWNEQHADLAAQFQALTGIDPNDFRAVRGWQLAHGLRGDGKIGPKTIEAAKDGAGDDAKAEKSGAAPVNAAGGGDGKTATDEKRADHGAGGGPKSDISFTDAEAGAVEDQAQAGELAEDAVAGGETGGEEHRAKGDGEKVAEEGSKLVQEGAEKTAEDIGGKGAGVATKALLLPRLVELLRAHQWKEAVKFVVGAVGYEERAELVKMAAEQLAGELSETAITWLERAVLAGAVVDVLVVGWEWTYGGIKAVQEAHEEGDRDSRIGIYAYAWADCVLKGQHDGAGAVDEEERRAMELGVQDGLATRAQSPELAELLIAQYGGEGNARRALEDALYKRAGISGVKTHHGK
jgi:hypothetical protein